MRVTGRITRHCACCIRNCIELSCLPKGVATSRPSPSRDNVGAQIILAIVVLGQIAAGDRTFLAVIAILLAQHGPQRRADEDQRTDQRRDGIAGQADDPGRSDIAEHQRLARPHGDLPEVDRHALFAERCLHQIVIADRGAAGRDQQIGAGRTGGKTLQGRAIIGAQCRDRWARRRRRAGRPPAPGRWS